MLNIKTHPWSGVMAQLRQAIPDRKTIYDRGDDVASRGVYAISDVRWEVVAQINGKHASDQAKVTKAGPGTSAQKQSEGRRGVHNISDGS
jgi:hypothetical protein